MKFSHVGITTEVKREEELYVPTTKVWISMAKEHDFPIEWLRYEEDSPVPDIIKKMPHIGYEVESLEVAGLNLNCILGPFEVEENKRVAFYELPDGAIIELMEVK